MDFVVSKSLYNVVVLNTAVNDSFCRSSNYSILLQVLFFFLTLKIVEMDQPRELNMNYVWHFCRKNVYISEKIFWKFCFLGWYASTAFQMFPCCWQLSITVSFLAFSTPFLPPFQQTWEEQVGHVQLSQIIF